MSTTGGKVKTVILAGGLGTRLGAETQTRPKPMVEIGEFPILWHIMKHLSHYKLNEFLVATGYRAEVIKRYFIDYHRLSGSMSVDLSSGRIITHEREREPWVVHLIDTGLGTNTGGRVKRLEPLLKDEAFLLTYGDGVGDIDLGALLDFHRSHGLLATVTAVRPPSRFGGLRIDGHRVQEFEEKPQIGDGWINGGYIVFEPEIFEYVEDDDTSLEAHAMTQLARDGQLAAYRHHGFWQCMDTPRDKRLLERLWATESPPWRIWE